MAKKTKEQFIEEARQIWGDKFDYSKVEYKTRLEKVCIICPEHGEFWQTPNDHLLGKGCPICNNSQGELHIYNHLNDINISFVREKIIHYNNINMRADFYLELKGRKYIIEYHGKQHYIPVEHFGGKLQFEKLQNRDNNLREYCKVNNIQLLEIKYSTKFEYIPELINNFINNE